MSVVVVCSPCIVVCECVMWLWACDLRCMHILCGWHPRWLLHSKQDFSGRGRLRKTAYELTADQRLKARGGWYNWPTPLSTFLRAPLPLGPRLLDLGIVSSALFPSSDLPPSRLRINKSIRGWKDDAVRALSSTEGGNQYGLTVACEGQDGNPWL